MPPRTPPGLIDPELLPESDPVASAALADHMSDTSSVHGIADPAQLALLTDIVRRREKGFAIDTPTIKVYPGFFVSLATGQDSSIKKVRYATDAGTATISLRRGGIAIGDFSNLAVTSSADETIATQVLSENDVIDLNVIAVSGVTRLFVTVIVEDT